MSLQDTLATFKQIQKGGGSTDTPRQNIQRVPSSVFTGNPDQLDEMVYGQPVTGDKNTPRVYDAREEMERLKKGLPQDLSNCKLPKAILESMKQQPLVDMSADPQMDAFTEKLKGKIAGIDHATNIIKQLDEADSAKHTNMIQETTSRPQNIANATIDYEMLKMIVESAVEKKLNEMKGTLLTESVGGAGQSPKVNVMKLTDKFMFLDSDDNVYECKMIYRGKNKRKKQ